MNYKKISKFKFRSHLFRKYPHDTVLYDFRLYLIFFILIISIHIIQNKLIFELWLKSLIKTITTIGYLNLYSVFYVIHIKRTLVGYLGFMAYQSL